MSADQEHDQREDGDGSDPDGESGAEPASKKALLKEKTGGDLLKKGTPPKISFRSDATIAPNSTARERFFEGKEAVVFAHDPDENTLLIAPLDDYDPDAEDEYSLSDENTVTSKPVCQKIGLELDATYRYDIEWDDEFGAVKIDLDQDPEEASQKQSDDGDDSDD
jgi:hypothetical protein